MPARARYVWALLALGIAGGVVGAAGVTDASSSKDAHDPTGWIGADGQWDRSKATERMRLIVPAGWVADSDVGWIDSADFLGEKGQARMTVYEIYATETSKRVIGWYDTDAQLFTRNAGGHRSPEAARAAGEDVTPSGATDVNGPG